MAMSEDYRFKPYQTLLEEALTDESMAGDIYRYMADISPNASAAERLRKIAADEGRHHLIVSHLLAELSGQGETGGQYAERMEYLLGHRQPASSGRGAGRRPFPQTYGDWVDLAEDIKAKDPDSAPIVNDRLNVVCFESGDIDSAKRWLVQKAGELGIS